MPSCITSDVGYEGCSTKAQPLLLALYEGCLLTAAPPDLERGGAPLSPPAPGSSRSLEVGLLLLAAAPYLGHGVAPLGGQSFYLLCSGKRVRMAKNDPSPYIYIRLLGAHLFTCDKGQTDILWDNSPSLVSQV